MLACRTYLHLVIGIGIGIVRSRRVQTGVFRAVREQLGVRAGSRDLAAPHHDDTIEAIHTIQAVAYDQCGGRVVLCHPGLLDCAARGLVEPRRRFIEHEHAGLRAPRRA